MSESPPTLEDAAFVPETVAPMTAEQAARLAACIDADPAVLDDGRLPTLWHWACFLPNAPTAALGVDGHPRRRAEMAAYPQRMWVGGRVRVAHPLRIGVPARRTSRLLHADAKDGSTGRFWLLTVGHSIEQDGHLCIDEEQDLVLRGESAVPTPGPDAEHAPEDEWVEEMRADPVLLFRFSAVTGNAHRIHYDQPYATGVEGYPDLVVHGPLTAVLLAELARRRTGRVAAQISFRARAPHFANRRFWLTGHRIGEAGDGAAATAAVRSDHTVAMTLEAR